jgi:hypothetical protein
VVPVAVRRRGQPVSTPRMSIEVEVNMRIPGLTLRAPNEADKVINNSYVRFTKLIQVPAIPKAGDPLTLTTSTGQTFESTVTRSDWSEDRSLFIVSCNYAKRSISADEYGALVNDAEWKMKQLI